MELEIYTGEGTRIVELGFRPDIIYRSWDENKSNTIDSLNFDKF